MNHDHSNKNHTTNKAKAEGMDNGSASATPASNKYDLVPENYEGVVYICPMHPEVRDITESRCPLCDMFLKPEEEVANSEHSHHH